jgi:rhodanese-related sulfurtransferase
MPTGIDRNEVQRLVREAAQLVDVLPREEYEELHLAGAVSIPLRELDARSAGALDASAPVITYCNDFL